MLYIQEDIISTSPRISTDFLASVLLESEPYEFWPRHPVAKHVRRFDPYPMPVPVIHYIQEKHVVPTNGRGIRPTNLPQSL